VRKEKVNKIKTKTKRTKGRKHLSFESKDDFSTRRRRFVEIYSLYSEAGE
jgi:hypothetical protein